MWSYKTQIGTLYIKKIKTDQYGICLGDMVYDCNSNPQALAENVRSFSCGCPDWDLLCGKITPPSDLSEWEQCSDLL